MTDKETSPPSPHSSLFTTEEGQKDLEALVNKRSDLEVLAAKRHQIEATAELEMDCRHTHHVHSRSSRDIREYHYCSKLCV